MNFTEKDKQFVEEALNRGATERMLVDYFVWKHRYARPPVAVPPAEARKPLEPSFIAYRTKVRAEFALLGRIAFLDPEGIRTPEQHYFYMRPQYYAMGFDNPARDFLLKIVPCNFLGKNVPGGVHESLALGLNRVVAILEQKSPGLSGVAATIRAQDGGFVPRGIAGSTELSNHAFGLAIDIDPPSNPHIKKDAIPLLNEVVKRKAGLDFDFGKSYSEGREWSRLLTDEQKLKVIFLFADRASRAVQDWLQEHLDTYILCKKEIAAGAKQGATQAEKDASQQAKIAMGDRDLQLVGLIEQQSDRATLQQWRKYGIQSLPYELVWAIKQAFNGNPSFRWGQEYHKSKDAMHFELLAINNVRGTISAAALTPHSSKLRPLEDWLPLPFLAFHAPDLNDFFDSKGKLITAPPPELRSELPMPQGLR